MSLHILDASTAEKFGVYESILIEYFRYWICRNRNKQKNLHEGHFWTYNTLSHLCKVYPYLTLKMIRTTIDSLVRQGVLLKSEFNRNRWDRTSWYAFADEAAFLDQPRRKKGCKGDFGPEIREPGWQQELPLQPAEKATRDAEKGKCTFAPEGNSIPVVFTVEKTGEEKTEAPPPVFFTKKENTGNTSSAAVEKEPFGREKSRSAVRQRKPVSERKGFLRELVRKYNTQRSQPYPGTFVRDFLRYWTQPSIDGEELMYENTRFFGIDWRMKSFWKHASPDERKGYCDKWQYELEFHKRDEEPYTGY